MYNISKISYHIVEAKDSVTWSTCTIYCNSVRELIKNWRNLRGEPRLKNTALNNPVAKQNGSQSHRSKIYQIITEYEEDNAKKRAVDNEWFQLKIIFAFNYKLFHII